MFLSVCSCMSAIDVIMFQCCTSVMPGRTVLLLWLLPLTTADTSAAFKVRNDDAMQKSIYYLKL